jgi:hypothetical protein
MASEIKYPNYDGTQSCARMGVEMFYQDYDNKRTAQEVADLKEFCSNCNIQVECMEYAIKHEKYGFWGGTTPYERRTIRNKRKIRLDLPENDWTKK